MFVNLTGWATSIRHKTENRAKKVRKAKCRKAPARLKRVQAYIARMSKWRTNRCVATRGQSVGGKTYKQCFGKAQTACGRHVKRGADRCTGKARASVSARTNNAPAKRGGAQANASVRRKPRASNVQKNARGRIFSRLPPEKELALKAPILYFQAAKLRLFPGCVGNHSSNYEKDVKKLFRFVKKYETKYCNFMSVSV